MRLHSSMSLNNEKICHEICSFDLNSVCFIMLASLKTFESPDIMSYLFSFGFFKKSKLLV